MSCDVCHTYRQGDLVCQQAIKVEGKWYVFRYYMCRWCRSAANRRWARNPAGLKKTKVVAWRPDEEVLKEKK